MSILNTVQKFLRYLTGNEREKGVPIAQMMVDIGLVDSYQLREAVNVQNAEILKEMEAKTDIKREMFELLQNEVRQEAFAAHPRAIVDLAKSMAIPADLIPRGAPIGKIMQDLGYVSEFGAEMAAAVQANDRMELYAKALKGGSAKENALSVIESRDPAPLDVSAPPGLGFTKFAKEPAKTMQLETALAKQLTALMAVAKEHSIDPATAEEVEAAIIAMKRLSQGGKEALINGFQTLETSLRGEAKQASGRERKELKHQANAARKAADEVGMDANAKYFIGADEEKILQAQLIKGVRKANQINFDREAIDNKSYQANIDFAHAAAEALGMGHSAQFMEKSGRAIQH